MATHTKLREDAYRAFSRNGLDPEIQVALDREYRDADALAETVLTDDGYQEFAATFVSREKTKLDSHNAGEPHDHPYDGVRSDPLCTCDDRYCTLKEGRLPRRIRTAADPVEETRQFKNDHKGDALVLQDLREEYTELCAEFDHRHRRIIICGIHGIHPDDLEGIEVDRDDEQEDATAEATVADD